MEQAAKIAQILKELGLAIGPVMVLVFGLVEFVKKMGVAGRVLLGVSMTLGVLFGGGFYAAALGLPADFLGWFTLVLFGIGCGLTTSGAYNFLDARFPRQ